MRLADVVMLAMMAVLATEVGAVSVTFLNADMEEQSAFSEGDTVICRCLARHPVGSPYTEAQLYDKVESRQVARNDQTFPGDDTTGGHTFSAASFTDTGDGGVEYRVTIGNVDRHDNGFRFYCEFFQADGVSSGAGGVAGELTVNWEPPTVQCADIPDQVKDTSAGVTYRCSTVDGDAESTGALSLWRNGEEVEAAAVETSPATPGGTRYELSRDATVSDVDDAYECRYLGSGGLEEYAADCTFNKPSCVADLADAPCSTGGAGSAHGPVYIPAILALAASVVFSVDG